jgi:flavoprotein
MHKYCETCGHCKDCSPHPPANKETEKQCSRCNYCETGRPEFNKYNDITNN